MVQHFALKEYIQLSRMSKFAECFLPIPTPVSLVGTFFFSWRLFLLALLCLEFHQLTIMEVGLLQILPRFFQCIFFRVWASKRHININCKQIIGGCKIWSSLISIWLMCDYRQLLMFLLSSHLLPIFSRSSTLHYIPFVSYRRSVQIYTVAIHSVR